MKTANIKYYYYYWCNSYFIQAMFYMDSMWVKGFVLERDLFGSLFSLDLLFLKRDIINLSGNWEYSKHNFNVQDYII